MNVVDYAISANSQVFQCNTGDCLSEWSRNILSDRVINMLSENLQSADVVDYVVVSGTVVYIKIVKKSDAKNGRVTSSVCQCGQRYIYG